MGILPESSDFNRESISREPGDVVEWCDGEVGWWWWGDDVQLMDTRTVTSHQPTSWSPALTTLSPRQQIADTFIVSFSWWADRDQTDSLDNFKYPQTIALTRAIQHFSIRSYIISLLLIPLMSGTINQWLNARRFPPQEDLIWWVQSWCVDLYSHHVSGRHWESSEQLLIVKPTIRTLSIHLSHFLHAGKIN